ncbi:Inositol oxygenase [Penicillium expansum]|nr:Inositol oxygenase [Penicillium expansum]
MAPVAISPQASPVFKKRDGQALEELSDAIDEINVLKDMKKREAEKKEAEEKGLYEESEFDKEKDKTNFRQYEDASDRVKNFYKEQHTKQTVAYNLKARHDFHTDRSNPRPGQAPLFFDAEGQWDVVGDTFPVGCGFDDKIVYGRDSFRDNEDFGHKIYDTKFGIYTPGCGLDKVMLSWGHDEYLYHLAKEQSTLPDEALAMIRYHSFYPWHSAGAYHELMNDHDRDMLRAVKAFNPYDLYSKSDGIPSVEELKPYYLELINEYFPTKVLKW